MVRGASDGELGRRVEVGVAGERSGKQLHEVREVCCLNVPDGIAANDRAGAGSVGLGSGDDDFA